MIPKHLESTWQLLAKAFPSGMSASEYWATLELLSPHMADENVAIVMSEFARRHVGEVLNDVFLVQSRSVVEADSHASVLQKLQECGFDDWVKDDT